MIGCGTQGVVDVIWLACHAVFSRSRCQYARVSVSRAMAASQHCVVSQCSGGRLMRGRLGRTGAARMASLDSLSEGCALVNQHICADAVGVLW